MQNVHVARRVLFTCTPVSDLHHVCHRTHWPPWSSVSSPPFNRATASCRTIAAWRLPWPNPLRSWTPVCSGWSCTTHTPPHTNNAGVHDVRKVFETVRWSGLDKVTSWNNYTERVHGTDASQFTYAARACLLGACLLGACVLGACLHCLLPGNTDAHAPRPGQHLNSTVDVWVGELYRAAKLVAVNTTNLHGVDLLRFVPTEGAAAPDPRYFQTIQGLMNITSPQAGGMDALSCTAIMAMFVIHVGDASLCTRLTCIACSTAFSSTATCSSPRLSQVPLGLLASLAPCSSWPTRTFAAPIPRSPATSLVSSVTPSGTPCSWTSSQSLVRGLVMGLCNTQL